MTSQAEKLGAYKRELQELRSVAVELHNRIVALEASANELVGACSHPDAKDITMGGAAERTKYCKDCGEKWSVPFETEAATKEPATFGASRAEGAEG